MFPQILASDQKILKITNLNNSKPAYQPPIVLKGIIQPFCLSYIFSTFMRTDSCSNKFRAETTKLWHKMRSAKNSVQHATWKASHPTQVGRKWRNGNVIYLKFCLVIRDLLKKKIVHPFFLKLILYVLTQLRHYKISQAFVWCFIWIGPFTIRENLRCTMIF